MRDDVLFELRRIGEQLDASLFPVVKNGGIVVPSNPAISPRTLGAELNHVKPGKARTEARSRPQAWASDRPRPSFGAWSYAGSGAPRPATSLVVSELRSKFANELKAVQQAYPGVRHWLDDDGMWLIVESSLLPGFSHKAVFIVAIRFADTLVRGWGFWGLRRLGTNGLALVIPISLTGQSAHLSQRTAPGLSRTRLLCCLIYTRCGRSGIFT